VWEVFFSTIAVLVLAFFAFLFSTAAKEANLFHRLVNRLMFLVIMISITTIILSFTIYLIWQKPTFYDFFFKPKTNTEIPYTRVDSTNKNVNPPDTTSIINSQRDSLNKINKPDKTQNTESNDQSNIKKMYVKLEHQVGWDSSIPDTSFRLLTIAPTIRTSRSVQLNGYFNQSSGIVYVGFEYGTAIDKINQLTIPLQYTAHYGMYSTLLNNLKPNTDYFFRAIAIYQGFKSKGSILTFTTPTEVNVKK
jgi:hypothetical protein